MLAATALIAFNDNAAITYLASLVPGFSEALKYVVMAGAATGGGFDPRVRKLPDRRADPGPTPPHARNYGFFFASTGECL